MIHAKQDLAALRNQWESCQACELGVRRFVQKGAFVFGEGTPGGIMLIGEGPGRTEEEEGRPFVGKSGEILRSILHGYHFTNYYITNIVGCRSCAQIIGDDGNPVFRKTKKGAAIPALRDEVPSPVQMAACAARLYEEIYLVDPVLIVSLGVTASEFLLRRTVAITRDRGTTDTCWIPGRTHQAVLTEKKRLWERVVKGTVVRPTEQNKVKYTVIPTLHPAYVLRKLSDHGVDSPWNLLASDIKRAIQIHDFIKDNVSPTEEREFEHDEENTEC